MSGYMRSNCNRMRASEAMVILRNWRLFPLVLLAGCAVDSARQEADVEPSAATQRVVDILDISLAPSTTERVPGEPGKEFRMNETEGWIAANGAWQIRTAVAHARLRCATFEVGIQLAAGAPGCEQPAWLTETVYGTRQRHCNAATLIHSGGGEQSISREVFENASCVRVVTRCSGNC